MQIFEDRRLKQTDSPDGSDSRFAAYAKLEGAHSILDLRRLVSHELIEAIRNDMKTGAYRMISIRPDAVLQVTEKSVERLEDEAIVAQMVHGGGKTFATERGVAEYGGATWHIHHGTTSVLCFSPGDLPTIFVENEEEFLDLMRSSPMWPLITECRTDVLRLTNMSDAAYLAEQVSRISVPYDQRGIFQEGLAYTKQHMKGKVSIPAELGTISIFQSGLVHAADHYSGQEVAGDLFAENI